MVSPHLGLKRTLTLSNAEAIFDESTRTHTIFENNLNPVKLAFIGKLSLSTFR